MKVQLPQLIVLHEDKQHWSFAHRVFEDAGWDRRKLRSVECGSWTALLGRFPGELVDARRRHAHVDRRLVVLMDEDTFGRDKRLRQLEQACLAVQVAPPTPADPLAIFLPARNIETWLAYLDLAAVSTAASVDETQSFPKLAYPSDCRPQVKILRGFCQGPGLPPSAPPSLHAACDEFKRLRTP